MNKFTYAAFSLIIGALFFMIVLLNSVAKLFAGVLTIALLLGTMLKMLLIVSVRQLLMKESTAYAAA